MFPSPDISADSLAIIIKDFLEILVIAQRSFSAMREDDNVLSYEVLGSDRASGPALALVMAKCRDEGRLPILTPLTDAACLPLWLFHQNL